MGLGVVKPTTYCYHIFIVSVFIVTTMITGINAQTFETGDNSTVVGCSSHCSYKDLSLGCWDKTLNFFEQILLAQIRNYVTIQINIDQWRRRNVEKYEPDFEGASQRSIQMMSSKFELLDDFEQLSLGSLESCFTENDETWLYSPESLNGDSSAFEEDLDTWLSGAVNKISYSTRSALARRLEKKKKKKAEKEDKEKKTNSRLSSYLAKIEEDSCEERSCNESEKSGKSGKNRTLAASATVNAPDILEVFEEEVFYDAMDQTPVKKAQTDIKSSKNTENAQFISSTSTAYETAKSSLSSTAHAVSGDFDDLENLKNLSEIERRALEQEKELMLEIQGYVNSNYNSNFATLHRQSRPGSASSVASSTTCQNLATSRSTDFRNTNGVNNKMAPKMNVVKNEGSLAFELTAQIAEVAEELLTHTLTSRLPLPRPLGVAGKTAIPAPTPRRSLKKRRSIPYSPNFSENGASCGASSASSVQLDDEECF